MIPQRVVRWGAALGLTLTILSGCAVNQDREVANYRRVLDEKLPAAPAVPGPGEVLTLQQALALANALNERLAMTGEDYLQALIDKDRALAKFLPSISIRPTYTEIQRFKAPPFVSGFFPLRAADLPVAVDWNIFNGFRDLADVERNEVMARYRLAVLLDTQADILVNTATVYYQILQLEQQIEVLKNSVALQEDTVRDMRDRLTAGIARPLDVALTESQASATRTLLIDARHRLATARAGLAFLTGLPSAGNPLIDGFDVPTTPGLDELQKQAYENRPEIQAGKALVTAAKKGLLAAIGEYMPSITLDFNYYITRQSFPQTSLWAFAAGMNIPIFEGGRIHANVRAAYSLVRQAVQYESLTERQVVEEVRVAYEDFDASDRRLKELATEAAAAEDAFALADQSYNVGLATNLERFIAQNRMLLAQLQLAAEKLNRKLVYLKLTKAVGQLIDETRRLLPQATTESPPAAPKTVPAQAAEAGSSPSDLTAEAAENAEEEWFE